MHIESKNDDFLMYILNGGKPVPSLYIQVNEKFFELKRDI